MLKKIVHEPRGGKLLKSQKISVFIMVICWISLSNGTSLSRTKCTQTLIICNFLSLNERYAIIER